MLSVYRDGGHERLSAWIPIRYEVLEMKTVCGFTATGGGTFDLGEWPQGYEGKLHIDPEEIEYTYEAAVGGDDVTEELGLSDYGVPDITTAAKISTTPGTNTSQLNMRLWSPSQLTSYGGDMINLTPRAAYRFDALGEYDEIPVVAEGEVEIPGSFTNYIEILVGGTVHVQETTPKGTYTGTFRVTINCM